MSIVNLARRAEDVVDCSVGVDELLLAAAFIWRNRLYDWMTGVSEKCDL